MIISYHTLYLIISYHIIPYHIISYRITYQVTMRFRSILYATPSRCRCYHAEYARVPGATLLLLTFRYVAGGGRGGRGGRYIFRCTTDVAGMYYTYLLSRIL